MATARTPHLQGSLWAIGGVLLISPDALILRLAAADAWTLSFWRNLLTLVAYGILLALLPRTATLAVLMRLDKPALAIALLYAASSVFFVLSISLTAVANTLVIVSAGPIFAALFSVLFAREAIALRTWVASLLVCGGIALVFAGEFHGHALVGNLCALGASGALAATFVLMRHTGEGRMLPLLLYGSLAATVAVLPFAAPASIDRFGMSILALHSLTLMPASMLLLMGATRLIPAPEVNLVLLLETLLGPLWVWWVIGEEPAITTLLGGAVLVGTLSVHSLIGLRAAMRVRREVR
jgi:drug/metabolite transporter (DMT)-like permease